MRIAPPAVNHRSVAASFFFKFPLQNMPPDKHSGAPAFGGLMFITKTNDHTRQQILHPLLKSSAFIPQEFLRFSSVDFHT